MRPAPSNRIIVFAKEQTLQAGEEEYFTLFSRVRHRQYLQMKKIVRQIQIQGQAKNVNRLDDRCRDQSERNHATVDVKYAPQEGQDSPRFMKPNPLPYCRQPHFTSFPLLFQNASACLPSGGASRAFLKSKRRPPRSIECPTAPSRNEITSPTMSSAAAPLVSSSSSSSESSPNLQPSGQSAPDFN